MKLYSTLAWSRYGPDAIMFYFGKRIDEEGFARGQAIHELLTTNPPPGMTEFVISFNSVLLEFDTPIADADAAKVSAFLAGAKSSTTASRRKEKRIPIIYDGPDLDRVAEINKISREEVAALHAATVYKVYAIGFAPGFPYLGDLNPRLHTPRLASPRKEVPAGSVAIGGGQTGIYPLRSPGGWNIIGHTTIQLFDPQRLAGNNPESAFFLQQGDRVRFLRQTG